MLQPLLHSSLPLALGMPGTPEMLIIAVIGLLVFGKRLPEVGRGLGKGIVEFKRGLKGVEDEVTKVDESTPPVAPQQQPRLAQQTTVQQFDPYTGKPVPSTVPPDAAHG